MPSPRTFASFVALTLAVGAPSLRAQETSDEPESPNIRYAAVTEIELGGATVEGGVRRPEGMQVLERRSASFSPLLQPRTDFDTEMFESVRAVR